MFFFPTRQEGVVRFYVGIRACDASTPRPCPVSSQSSSPVAPAEYPAKYPLASGSHRVSRQSSLPVDPTEYPARTARQWIPPSIPPERIASGSRQASHQSSPPVDPAEYPAEYPLPVDPAEYPASIEPQRLASIRQWLPPVSRQSSSPVWFCLMSKRADGNLESKSLGCGGICCNGRKLVSVEGGDCSKRSNYFL